MFSNISLILLTLLVCSVFFMWFLCCILASVAILVKSLASFLIFVSKCFVLSFFPNHSGQEINYFIYPKKKKSSLVSFISLLFFCFIVFYSYLIFFILLNLNFIWSTLYLIVKQKLKSLMWDHSSFFIGV